MNYSGTDIRSGISILIVMVIGAFCSTAAGARGQVKLVSVKPTVFFVRRDNVLAQIGEATVNNLSQEQVKITLESQVPGTRTSEILFHYSLTTHEGDWQKGNCAGFGWAAANQFIVDDVHGKKDGPLAPGTMSFCSVDRPNVLLTTLKRAEDGAGIIIRLIETQGEPTTASVTFPHIAAARATITNLVEENKSRAVFTEHQVQVNLRAFGTATIRIETD